MSHTPTTEDVRRGYREGGLGDGSYMDQDEERALNDAAFDRWLEAHDREVAAKSWALGYAQGKEDERLAETLKVDIGLGGHAAANRQNPYEEIP